MSERAGSRPHQPHENHRPARQRHRAPQRASTPLTQLTDAVTDQLGDARRTGAIAVISTGLVAGVAMPAQAAVGQHPSTSPLTSSAGPATAAAPAYSSLGARALTAGAALGTGASTTAPRTAVVAFESGRFTALPKPPAPPKPKPAAATRPIVRKAAVTPAAEPTTRREAREARERAAAHAAALRRRAVAEKKAATARAAEAAHQRSAAAAKHASDAKRKVAEKKHRAPASKKKSATKGASVLSIAARYVGTPYRYGGTTPRGFDCSGFTRYVYSRVGISLPRTANQQMHATRRVKRSHARAGDLVFFVSGGHAYHVGLYAGGGMMYDSPRSGKTVSKRKIWDAAVVFGRVTG